MNNSAKDVVVQPAIVDPRRIGRVGCALERWATILDRAGVDAAGVDVYLESVLFAASEDLQRLGDELEAALDGQMPTAVEADCHE